MAGTLLSGWRIRLFDTNGTPLYPGRVRFYDATTSLPKTVYSDKDLSVALGTYVDTDIEGYLPAIWLDAGYYKADVQQRIQDDPETWQTLWNINNVGKELAQTGNPGSGVLAYCETIAEMKAIPAGEIDAAIVAGYYEAGDCGEPMFFVWNPDASRADDGGAYIRSNDTPPLSAGRYIQNINDTILDIRKWGGIPNKNTIDCTAALTNMQNYAGFYQHYPTTPPTIGFVAPGIYYFSGAVTLSATHYIPQYSVSTKIPYYIGPNVELKYMTAPWTLTIANPTKIETDEPLVEYPNSLVINQGTMEYVRPQWVSDYANGLENKIAHALTYGMPVKVYGKYADGEITVDQNDVVWDGKVPVIIESTSLYFTGSYSLTINCPIQILHNTYVFRLSNVLITPDIEVNAAWFGWGSKTGDNGPYLQAAIKANNGQSAVVIPAVQGATIGTSVNGTVSFGYTNIIRPMGTLMFTGTAGLTGVYLDAPDNMFAISVPTATMSNITLLNSYISPYWFGAIPGSIYNGNGNASSLEAAIQCSMRSNCHVDGLGKHFSINRGMSFTGGGTSGGGSVCRLKNIFINPTSDYNVSLFPWLVTIAGGIDVELEYVAINENNAAGISALYCTAFWQRINKCFFGNDVYIRGEDVVFDGNQLYGEVTGSNFYSATRGCIVTNNTFTQCRIHLQGDTSVKAGRSFPMLEKIIFSNNVLTNLDGSFYRGCVYLIATAPNTLVSGLIITNNVFGGNIPQFDSNGTRIDDLYRYRIDDRLGTGASWAVPNQANNNVRHLLTIRDNTYQWYDPYRADPVHPSGMLGHSQNFLPATSGFYIDGARTLTGTQSQMSNSIIMDTFGFNLDRRQVFTLTGDTKSQFTILHAYVKGWRKKTGEHTWDTFKSVDADISINADTDSVTSATIYLGVNKYQWGGTAGSSGWAGSQVSFGVDWSIYER